MPSALEPDETFLRELPHVWRAFRVGVVAAHEYPMRSQLGSPQGAGLGQRDIYLERALPALLYIKGTAIFDEALQAWISRRGAKMPKEFRNTMGGRVRFLLASGHLANQRLVSITERRNALAHERDARCSWRELQVAVIYLERALVALGLVEATGELTSRASMTSSREGLPAHVQFRSTFMYEVLQNGSTAETLSWCVDVPKPHR